MTSIPHSDSEASAPLDTVERARRGLAIYLVLVIIGSGIVEWMILRTGDSIDKHMGLVTMLMWTPAVASLIARRRWSVRHWPDEPVAEAALSHT